MQVLKNFFMWLRWEFSRSIEVDKFILFIIIERFFKAALLIAGGIVLFVFANDGVVTHLATAIHSQLGLNPGRHLLLHFWDNVVSHYGKLSFEKQHVVAVALILYGVLDVWEALGLMFRRRWAEYLVLLASASFLPLEISEIARHLTIFKLLAIGTNLFIIVYLVWSKRLFLDRQSEVSNSEKVT